MDLILGHNQFIGINHTSEDKSIELQKRFYDAYNIYKVVEIAAELGYKNMIIETHPKMLEFIKLYKKFQTFDMNFYLQVPNIQGYVDRMSEKGFSGLLLELAQMGGLKALSSLALKNVMHLARKNYFSMAASALELEVAPFMDINIKALLLHNVSTDLLLSLNISSAFSEYITYVKDNLKLNPGFTTVNFKLFKENFENWGFHEPLVMTPINSKGFDMNPSKNAVESAIKAYKGDIMAMNILGAGAFSINEANDYLSSFDNIKSCVVGASSREHLHELINVFQFQ